MAEPKAVPYNLVAGDKGKKSENVGIAFHSTDLAAKVPWSMTLSLTRLKKLLESGNLGKRVEEASKTQYKNDFEGEETVRIVGFRKTKKPAGSGF